MKISETLKDLFNRKGFSKLIDPIKQCLLYKYKGCSFVDSPFCDFPNCSMNDKFIKEKFDNNDIETKKKYKMGIVEPNSDYTSGLNKDIKSEKLAFIKGALDKYPQKEFNDELIEYIRNILSDE